MVEEEKSVAASEIKSEIKEETPIAAQIETPHSQELAKQKTSTGEPKFLNAESSRRDTIPVEGIEKEPSQVLEGGQEPEEAVEIEPE